MVGVMSGPSSIQAYLTIRDSYSYGTFAIGEIEEPPIFVEVTGVNNVTLQNVHVHNTNAVPAYVETLPGSVYISVTTLGGAFAITGDGSVLTDEGLGSIDPAFDTDYWFKAVANPPLLRSLHNEHVGGDQLMYQVFAGYSEGQAPAAPDLMPLRMVRLLYVEDEDQWNNNVSWYDVLVIDTT